MQIILHETSAAANSTPANPLRPKAVLGRYYQHRASGTGWAGGEGRGWSGRIAGFVILCSAQRH